MGEVLDDLLQRASNRIETLCSQMELPSTPQCVPTPLPSTKFSAISDTPCGRLANLIEGRLSEMQTALGLMYEDYDDHNKENSNATADTREQGSVKETDA